MTSGRISWNKEHLDKIRTVVLFDQISLQKQHKRFPTSLSPLHTGEITGPSLNTGQRIAVRVPGGQGAVQGPGGEEVAVWKTNLFFSS